MLNKIQLRNKEKVSAKLLEKVLIQNRKLAEVQKNLYKSKSQNLFLNNSEAIRTIAKHEPTNLPNNESQKSEIPQISQIGIQQQMISLTKNSKVFKNAYSKHIDFLLSKNPQYFEHKAGRCKCYQTNWQQRCCGMDQNQYQNQNSQFTTTYGKDFLHSQSFNNSKEAQLKSDPYYSSFYDSGSKKQFMNSSTIAQSDYQKRNSLINKANLSQHKMEVLKGSISLEQSPPIPQKTHYNSEFSNFICLPVINYHQLAKAKNNLSLGKFKLNGKSIYNSSYYNQLERFIPNQQHLRQQSLELFRKSLPLQAVSATKSQFSRENAQIRETEKPIHYQYKPQFLPSYSQQYVTTSRGTFSRISEFKEQSVRSQQLTEQENIEILRNQLKSID